MLSDKKVNKIFEELSDFAAIGQWENIERCIDSNPGIAKLENKYSESLLIVLSGYAGSSCILKKLINLGTDVNKITKEGESALTMTILGGSTYGLTTLPEMDVLLQSGANVNYIGPSGNPPLHWAIVHNRLEHAKKLISYGADPYLKTGDLYPETAFDIAVKSKNTSVLDLLKNANSTHK